MVVKLQTGMESIADFSIATGIPQVSFIRTILVFIISRSWGFHYLIISHTTTSHTITWELGYQYTHFVWHKHF